MIVDYPFHPLVLCKETKIESRVPHCICNSISVFVAHDEEIFACIFMPNQTPIWFYFFGCFLLVLSVWSRGESRVWEVWKWEWCALFVITSIFKSAKKRKREKIFLQNAIFSVPSQSVERTWLFKEFHQMTRFCLRLNANLFFASWTGIIIKRCLKTKRSREDSPLGVQVNVIRMKSPELR